jgi:hypothetical protein
MTDETTRDLENLLSLKAQADELGITYHPSIGAVKLQEKITDWHAHTDVTVNQNPSEAALDDVPATSVTTTTLTTLRSRKKKEQTALRRIRLTCMNPMKSAWKGELITVGNSVTGSITKYVPYNEVWHVPQIMLNVIKDRMCQIFPDKKSGVVVAGGKIIPEFAIEELAPLTEVELKDLAQRQGSK